MRMWMVDPSVMCNQHILGEHLECHMFVSTINQNKRKLDGFIKNGLLEADKLVERHDLLVQEMTSRKMNHKTPIDSPSRIIFDISKIIDVEDNIRILYHRCPKCKEKIEKGLDKGLLDKIVKG